MSSVKGLWCINDCKKEDDDFYKCMTLFGKDYCSPEKDKTTKGDECAHACQYNSEGSENKTEDETAGRYFCFGTDDNSTRKGCGYYPKEDRDTLERLEYAQVGSSLAICADQCRPVKDGDNYTRCTVLEWKDDKLDKGSAYCLGSAPPTSVGTIVGPVIFVVAFGLVCIFL